MDQHAAKPTPGKKETRTSSEKRPTFKLGCWHIRRMTIGLEKLQNISDASRSAGRHLHLHKKCVSGSLRVKDYTYFPQTKSSEDLKEHGVGFAVWDTL